LIAGGSALFFAPAHIQKRRADWGPGVFEKKSFLFWHKAALHSRAWLKFDRVTGLAGMQAAYGRVLNGESAPDHGVVVAL